MENFLGPPDPVQAIRRDFTVRLLKTYDSTPERERRQALEYTEDTEPLQDQAPVALKEAEVSLPNLPLPRSTDGSVECIPPALSTEALTINADMGCPNAKLLDPRHQTLPPRDI